MQGMITITVSDCPDPELAESIARAQRHMPGWSERVVGFIFDCKTRSDCFNIIASADGTVIGRVQCLRSITDKGRWLYGDMFVASEYRRRHIAEKMMNAALDVLRRRGCRRVCAFVGPGNMPSLCFQNKMGFKEVPWERFDDFLNEGEIMFECELTAYNIIGASEKAALYICKICDMCAEELHLGNIGEPSFYRGIKDMLSANAPDEENFLIRSGAIPCAWLKLNGLADGAETAWISMLAVAPPFRRRGAGLFAVGFAEKFLISKGKKTLRIHTTKDNTPALSLYEKCGYSAVEKCRAVSGDGEERVCLTLEKKLFRA